MAFHLMDKLAVEDEGDGDAVVCLHGLGGSSNTWTPLMPALAQHRVLRIDLPGSGRSRAGEAPMSIERMVDAVLSVCTRLGVEHAHWLGHSMGTIVCQHVAVAEPRRVRSLALFGPLLAPPDAARANIRARGAKARAEGPAGMQAIADTLVQASLSAHSREQIPAAAAFVRESVMRQEPSDYARSCEALAEAQPAAVEAIAVPMLLVTGDEDAVAPPQAVRAMVQRMAGVKGGARVGVLPRTGH